MEGSWFKFKVSGTCTASPPPSVRFVETVPKTKPGPFHFEGRFLRAKQQQQQQQQQQQPARPSKAPETSTVAAAAAAASAFLRLVLLMAPTLKPSAAPGRGIDHGPLLSASHEKQLHRSTAPQTRLQQRRAKRRKRRPSRSRVRSNNNNNNNSKERRPHIRIC